jgi:SAM-dependent methyltransferase
MHDGYRHRESVSYCDATGSAEEWQREVYQFAREVFDLHGLGTVCDIGCGSGHKLLQHFGHASTVGVDVPATCAVLRKRWPARSWLDSFTVPPVSVDLVIAADVIEHLQDPDELLGYIQKLHPKWIVVSTPDRNLLREGTHDGPPHEPTHVREWSYAEFRAYIGSRFEIEAHFITWPAQATQCVLCRPRES